MSQIARFRRISLFRWLEEMDELRENVLPIRVGEPFLIDHRFYAKGQMVPRGAIAILLASGFEPFNALLSTTPVVDVLPYAIVLCQGQPLKFRLEFPSVLMVYDQ